MKNQQLLSTLASIALGSALLHGQSFSSGSDGSYGPMNITANTTLTMPSNGVFNCTTINIGPGATLRFTSNPLNTPVYLLATGDVTIAGSIDLSGQSGNSVVGGPAGPGGFAGGSPGSVSVPPGAGFGPGAGVGGSGNINTDGAGAAAYGNVYSSGTSTNKGSVYGNALLIPLIGGSGGGGTAGTPGRGGGGGGGGLLIASNTRINLSGGLASTGSFATGGAYNGGSGGAIRLVAPIVAGGGRIDVTGHNGGDGRIRIDSTDRTSLNFNLFPTANTSIGSLMLVFPSPLPRLDITQAAGTPVPLGSGPVNLQLPFGSSPNQSITVQAQNFNAQVPITLVLTPDHGNPSVYTSSLNNTAANNPASLTVPVVLPVNEQTTVQVYSK